MKRYVRMRSILCKLFANKNCLHFSANKIVRKQMDANNANNFSKHIGIKVEIFWVKLLNFQWNQLQKTIIWPKIIIGKFICIKWYQKMRMAKVKEFIIHNFLRRILASHFLILMDIIAKYSKIFIKKIKIDDTKFKKKEKSH